MTAAAPLVLGDSPLVGRHVGGCQVEDEICRVDLVWQRVAQLCEPLDCLACAPVIQRMPVHRGQYQVTVLDAMIPTPQFMASSCSSL